MPPPELILATIRDAPDLARRVVRYGGVGVTISLIYSFLIIAKFGVSCDCYDERRVL